MDEQQQQQPQPTPNAISSTTDPPQQPQQPPPSQPPPTQPLTPPIQQQPTQTSTSTSTTPNPAPILKPLPSPTPSPPQQPPQPKPTLPTSVPRPTAAAFARPWQQDSSHFTHFSSSSPSVSSIPSPTLSSQLSGSIALGVPSSHSSPSPPSPSPSQPTSFSGSFGRSLGGASSSNASQVRPTMQGMGIGSSIASSSQMRPSGISAQYQQRPVQSSLRPPSSPTSQSPAIQNFQGHGIMRASAVGSSGSSTPTTAQTTQSPSQPWLSSGSQGKPPLPPHSYRPQINSPSLQQRSHIHQQHHSLPTVSQQQHISSPQVPQSIPSQQQQEHFGQQFSQSRASQSLPHQQVSRGVGSANQKPSSLAMVQTSTVHPPNQNKAAIQETDASGGRILSKRSIHELVNQIDPSEKLDPEVEDILVDIAEDFVDSITTFGCSLAKHRKSDTLEAKDILLHLERNWNMTLPGFSGDEIKTYRKLLTNEVHKERLAVIKKSILVSEAANAKHFVGQAAVNAKGNLGKAAANILGSPNVKVREVT